MHRYEMFTYKKQAEPKHPVTAGVLALLVLGQSFKQYHLGGMGASSARGSTPPLF